MRGRGATKPYYPSFLSSHTSPSAGTQAPTNILFIIIPVDSKGSGEAYQPALLFAPYVKTYLAHLDYLYYKRVLWIYTGSCKKLYNSLVGGGLEFREGREEGIICAVFFNVD